MAEIYKNNDSQILFGNGGNVFKKPFNFTNGFTPIANEYVEISNLTVTSSNVSILGLKKYTSKSMIISAQIESGYHMQIGGRSNDTLFTTPPSSFIEGANDVDESKNLALIYHHNNAGFYTSWYGSLRTSYSDQPSDSGYRTLTRDLTSTFVASVIRSFTIGAGGSTTDSSGNIITSYSGTGSMHKNVLLYDRELSTSELKYIWNNGLLNEPLVLSGCICYFKLNKAEIIDFSITQDGSDMRIGVRDFSGSNNHGEIKNLPVGTNEEKLTYANANLFKPYL